MLFSSLVAYQSINLLKQVCADLNETAEDHLFTIVKLEAN